MSHEFNISLETRHLPQPNLSRQEQLPKLPQTLRLGMCLGRLTWITFSAVKTLSIKMLWVDLVLLSQHRNVDEVALDKLYLQVKLDWIEWLPLAIRLVLKARPMHLRHQHTRKSLHEIHHLKMPRGVR